MTDTMERIGLDRLAAELRSLSGMDVERLFDRMSPRELESLFAVAFADEICEARDLREMLDDAEAATDEAEEECERLRDEIADLKADLKSVECDRDLLQGRIHQLTGETFDV